MVVVVAGNNYVEEAKQLCKYLDARLVNVKYRVFPDGERYLRLMEPNTVSGETVIVVNTLYPNQVDSLFETTMLINAARRAGASKIIAYIPYIAYSRQDKVFLPGEPVTAEVVMKLLRHSGADCLVTVDIHSIHVLEFFGECCKNLLVFDRIVESIIDELYNPIAIAPDVGALHRARYIHEKLGLEYDHLTKKRDRETGEVSLEPKELDVRDRDIVLVDDIISTGGTIAKASETLLKQGARRVVVVASHGLLIGNAVEKMKKAGVYRVLLANTLGIRFSDPLIEYVDITPIIGRELRDMVIE